jgi:GT2 family glycosyltransferase
VARASVIIPVLGDPRQMEDTLVSVLENRPADCQVIVVFNQPYDDPYELAGEVDFIEAPTGAGWAECVNRAVAHSSGEVVFVVHCAVEVEPGWLEAATEALARPGVAAAARTTVDRLGGALARTLQALDPYLMQLQLRQRSDHA